MSQGLTRGRMLVGAVIAVVALIGGWALFSAQSGYQLKFVLPSAAQLPEGAPVLISGQQVGRITELAVQDGKAVATVSISGSAVPLHEGTTSRVEWFSALGERFLTIMPGPANNAAIPSGSLYQAQAGQIEVDQVLAALDKPTRDRLSSAFAQLNGTVTGKEPELNQTLKTAGPTVQALGDVLAGVGKDGPAIKALVKELHEVMSVASDRQAQLRGVIGDLTAFTGTTAAQQRQLNAGLAELPSTLRATRDTLDKVHPAVEATVPLLHDLEPATDRLPSVARNLSPLLEDLRPSVKDLRPTVEALRDLLHQTPDLLDTARDDLPTLTDMAGKYGPGAAFLRPYTPEFIGWITGWGMAFSHYDSQGHVWAGLLAPGSNAFNEKVGPNLPGSQPRAEPKPGEAVGQPWEDATVDAAGGGER
ncbi:MlaD family protein [Pseudonocardia spinosispora]|uniref:MlaD family protein n=1 Tax=Pseudonocardia spinosispora TaxID=103441 RepID=UPI0003F96829|nr:MlaD family protein [Pseudonocardia spinosispora]